MTNSPTENNSSSKAPTFLLFLILPVLGVFAAFMLIMSERQVQTIPDYVAPPTPMPVTPLPTSVNVLNLPIIDFELPLLGTDQTVSLSDYNGRIVFLNFWATWCEPCKRELPAFAEFTQANADDPTAPIILAVNYGESAELIEAFLSEQGITGLNILLDTDSSVSGRYGAFRLPTTYVIDESGVVRYPKFGEMHLEDIEGFIDWLG